MIVDNDLLSIQQARILAENAKMAQRALATFTQEQLDGIVESIADAVEQHADALAVMSREETDYGRWQDKQLKIRFVCGHIRQQLRGMRCIGIIGEDRDRHLMDVGVPVGVIVALCPSTSPVSTAIYTTLIAIKSGNAVIFSPHPRASKSMTRVLDIMIEAAQSHGLPEGCLSYLETVTKTGTEELMNHAATSLIMISGVPGMLKAAHAAGKPVIFGGTGNGPAFIERTADIRQAVRDIIRSKTFDNGIAPGAEQSIVVDSCIAQEVRRVLQECGAYFMTEEESLRLGELFFCPDGRRRTGMVGISAAALARKAGITVPKDVTVLVAERKYVSDADPYSRELLSPVLAFYVEDDWMHACEKCIELLLHERNAHTLVIHSGDAEVIRQFALKKPVGRMLVNTPGTLGGMGATTNLFPSMILGSGSAGFGITSDNVSPLNFIYTRKVGYGEKYMDGMAAAASETEQPRKENGMPDEHSNTSTMQTIQQILAEAIKVMNGSADR